MPNDPLTSLPPFDTSLPTARPLVPPRNNNTHAVTAASVADDGEDRFSAHADYTAMSGDKRDQAFEQMVIVHDQEGSTSAQKAKAERYYTDKKTSHELIVKAAVGMAESDKDISILWYTSMTRNSWLRA